MFLSVSCGQISAVHHKDMKLSKLLDVVHSKLDASLDVDFSRVCRINAAADLFSHDRGNKNVSDIWAFLFKVKTVTFVLCVLYVYSLCNRFQSIAPI